MEPAPNRSRNQLEINIERRRKTFYGEIHSPAELVSTENVTYTQKIEVKRSLTLFVIS